jgi:TrmH family RNA methyltransferase
MSMLDAVRVVLLEPRDPVNIAAAVRVMKNMGVSDLRLVRPVAYDPWRIEGIAHDTRDLVEGIRHHDSLDEALADCVRVAAFAGKRRAARWTVRTPERAADDLMTYATTGPVALLFGREDWGLPGEALDRAHIIVTIPTTEHASLNLAQAVLIGLYELHLRAGDATRTLDPPRKSAPPPTAEQFERLFVDAERALAAVDFFKTRNAELILRTVRSLAFRAAPDARELELARAMLIEVVRAMERARGTSRDDSSRD